jgi:RsiW-degrading membrane proteinase PrsW (M82 family)
MELAVFLIYLLVSGTLSLFFLSLVWVADRYEREPFWLLLLAAAWGGIPAIFVSCFAEVILGTPVQMALGRGLAQVIGPVLIAPPVEEVAKALPILLIVLLYRHEFDDILDGMVYGAAVGIGFSFVEDAMYFVGALGQSGWGGGAWTFAFRNVAFVLNHSLFSAITGIGFGAARCSARGGWGRIVWPAAGLGVATALHMAHNLLAHFQAPGLIVALLMHWAGGLGLMVLVPILWGIERGWIVQRLGSEVREGLIPVEALGALPFSGKSGRSIPVSGRWALRRDLVELAFHRRSSEDGWSEPPEGELGLVRSRVRERFSPSRTDGPDVIP